MDCHNLVIPKDLKQNLLFRKHIRDEAVKSRKVRDALRHVCAEDILFFLNVFGWLFEPRVRRDFLTGQRLPKVIPFITWPHQDIAILGINEVLGESDILGEKSRTEGATWIACWFGIRDLTFEDMVVVDIVSRNAEAIYKSDDAGTLLWKIAWGMRQLPFWMIGYEGKHWQHAISTNVITNLRRKGTISGFAASPEVGSGSRAKWFLIDELSKIPRPKDEQALTATQAVTDCRFIIATPRGSANAYYRITHEESSAYRFKLMWWDNPTKNRGLYKLVGLTPEAVNPDNNPLLPEYSPPSKRILDRWEMLRKRGYDLHKGVRSDWYDHECARLSASPQTIAQEQDCDFGGSAHQVFGSEFIEIVNTSAKVPLRRGTWSCDPETLKGEFNTIEGGPFWLWCDLDGEGKPPNRRYAMGVDLGAGSGGDYTSNSVLIVIDLETGEQVAEFATKTIAINEFADLCRSVGKCFYDAHLAWDINGMGGKFTTRVREKQYPDPFKRQVLWTQSAKMEKRLGWYTDAKNKVVLFGDINTEVRMNTIVVRSKLLAEEFSQYIQNELNDNKIEHQSAGNDSSHGDRVIAFGIALQAKKQRPIATEDKIEEGDIAPGVPPPYTFAAREQEILDQERKGVGDWDDRSPSQMMGSAYGIDNFEDLF